MATKETSTSKTLLILLILIITFPFWIAVGGLIIGLIGGLFGITFGILGAIFGGMIALIALPFKLLFGWEEGSCGIWSFHGNGFVWFALLIFAVLVITRRNR